MNTIHPTALIGAKVRIGTGNVIGPGVIIGGDTALGNNNWIGAGTVLGSPPEVRSHPHPADWMDTVSDAGLTLGNDNVIRESVQMHAGWHTGTRVGSGLFVMNQCYLAHDGVLEDDVTLASSVLLAGHVSIGRGANLGLGSAVHQGRTIGPYAMVGMGSVVTRHIPPFALSYGSPASAHGINRVGMSRAGFSATDIEWAESASGDAPSARVATELAWFADATTH